MSFSNNLTVSSLISHIVHTKTPASLCFHTGTRLQLINESSTSRKSSKLTFEPSVKSWKTWRQTMEKPSYLCIIAQCNKQVFHLLTLVFWTLHTLVWLWIWIPFCDTLYTILYSICSRYCYYYYRGKASTHAAHTHRVHPHTHTHMHTYTQRVLFCICELLVHKMEVFWPNESFIFVVKAVN